MPGIKVPALAQVAQEMKSLELGHDDMLVLDLLFISSFIGTDVDRLPSPAYPVRTTSLDRSLRPRLLP